MTSGWQNERDAEKKPDPDTIAALDAAIARGIREAAANLAEQEKLPPICEPGGGIYYDPRWKDAFAESFPTTD